MLGPLAAKGALGPLAVGTGSLGSSVAWTSIVGCVVDSPSTLRKTGSSGWNAGGVSDKAIPSASAGWMEIVVSDPTDSFMFGLSKGDTDQTFGDIDFAFYHFGNSQIILVYESGVGHGIGSPPIVAGDRLRISVSASGVVTYTKNGGLLYTSLLTAAFPLLVDCSIYGVGDKIVGATIYAAAGLVPSGY